jgi:hypothetical protein
MGLFSCPNPSSEVELLSDNANGLRESRNMGWRQNENGACPTENEAILERLTGKGLLRVHQIGMSADFHIYVDPLRGRVCVRQEGLLGERVFPTLTEATRHLRGYANGRDAHVVIHDLSGIAPNRIPLHVESREISAG